MFPVSSFAQSVDIQSQMISLLQQIVQLQTQLITSLTSQIGDLQQQLTRIATPTQPPLTIQNCTIIDPPQCSTTLKVFRDSYNCVTGYGCSVAITPINESCTDNGKTYANGQSQCHVVPGAITGSVTCSVQNWWTCHNGQWVPATQTSDGLQTDAQCVAHPPAEGQLCNGLRFCYLGLNGHYWTTGACTYAD